MGRSMRPFLGQEALARGELSTRELRTHVQRVYRNVYIPQSAVLTAADRARAAWLWCGGEAALVGLSAAAIHGAKWIDANLAAEICRPDRRHPPGIKVRTFRLPPDDVCWVDDMRLTTPERTAFDIGSDCCCPTDRFLFLTRSSNRRVSVSMMSQCLPSAAPGVHGRRRVRTALALVDGGAESPQETRVRLVLVRAGLPSPQTQICFSDERGVVRIRVDMGWPDWKVAVEYDGTQHWADAQQRSWDIDRNAILESLGWVVVRVSAEMLSRPHVIVQRVVDKLRKAGWQG
jgi:hypothetical protein